MSALLTMTSQPTDGNNGFIASLSAEDSLRKAEMLDGWKPSQGIQPPFCATLLELNDLYTRFTLDVHAYSNWLNQPKPNLARSARAAERAERTLQEIQGLIRKFTDARATPTNYLPL